MKHLLYSGLSLLLLISSCIKKDNPEPEPAPTTTGTPTTTGSPGPGTTQPMSKVSAIFTIGNSTVSAFGFSLASVDARAYFSSVPQTSEVSSTAIQTGSVILNDHILDFESSSGTYQAMLSTAPPSATWTVTGANGFPAMEIPDNKVMPAAEKVDVFPDTVHNSHVLNLQLNNVSNITHASFLMMRQDGTMNGLILKDVKTGNNTISLSPAQLQALTGPLPALCSIVLQNNSEVNISGKLVRLSRQIIVTKHVVILP